MTCPNHASFCLLAVAGRGLVHHEEVDRAPRPVVGLVFQVGVAEKFSQALGFESLDPFFFRISKQDPCFTALAESGGDKRLA